MPGTGIQSTASALGNHISGLSYGPSGPQFFSFSDNGLLGRLVSMGGHTFGLRSDVASQLPLGAQSFSVLDSLRPVGFVGQNPFGPGYVSGGDLSSQLCSAIISALTSTALL